MAIQNGTDICFDCGREAPNGQCPHPEVCTGEFEAALPGSFVEEGSNQEDDEDPEEGLRPGSVSD